MRYIAGGVLVLAGGLVVYGALTGRLAAMIAALVKPDDLIDGDLRSLQAQGGAVAGTGSTPDVPPPASIIPKGHAGTLSPAGGTGLA